MQVYEPVKAGDEERSPDAYRQEPEIHQDTVDTVGAMLIGLEESVDLAQLFRLLGDPTRVRILFALLEAGELCVCDVAAVVGTSETKVSQAMRLLRGAGVVRNRRDGRNVYYRLDDDHVRMLLDISRAHVAHGSGADGGVDLGEPARLAQQSEGR